jgi:hypothetical protein
MGEAARVGGWVASAGIQLGDAAGEMPDRIVLTTCLLGSLASAQIGREGCQLSRPAG